MHVIKSLNSTASGTARERAVKSQIDERLTPESVEPDLMTSRLRTPSVMSLEAWRGLQTESGGPCADLVARDRPKNTLGTLRSYIDFSAKFLTSALPFSTVAVSPLVSGLLYFSGIRLLGLDSSPFSPIVGIPSKAEKRTL
ncbi:MAG: hypothetical protein JWM11_2740 [Planctomycetaceae bacterium]|nr:hypothetical protein [Planctomycetaceae bacterium]